MPTILAVIGKGTAGAMAYNHFANYTNYEIDCYFDSTKKEQSVGEGTTISLPRTLHHTIGFEYYMLPEVDGHYKNGIEYIDWTNKNFMHTFPDPDISMHFNAVKLQEYLKDKNKNRVTFKDVNVENIYDINADYIIDCSGTPSNYAEHSVAKYIPVNAVYVRQCMWDFPRYDYTLCIARPYGWIFGIPLRNRISFGYLYNNKINKLKDVEEDLLNVIESYKLKDNLTEVQGKAQFKNYYRKENFYERITYNGNASFFLEPMEATSLTTVDNINRKVFDILENNADYNTQNIWYKEKFKELQDIIVMHYLGATKYDTEFWDYAKELAQDCLGNTSYRFKDILKNVHDNNYELDDDYGVWGMHSFKQNIYSMNILKALEDLNV